MHLYAFGSNGSGQLGVGSTHDTSTPQICLFPDGTELPGRPLRIVAGGNHTLLLLDDGTVYCSGAARDGRVYPQSSTKPQTTFQRAYISTLGEHRAKLCSAFWDGSVFVNDRNELFTAGLGSKGEQGIGVSASLGLEALQDWLPLQILGEEIVDLTSSVGHSVLVLANGQVFGWGNGRKGQLGEPAGVIWTPREFQHLEFPVIRAVCGIEFTCLVGRGGRNAILGSDKHQVRIRSSAPILYPKDIAASWGSIFLLDYPGNIESMVSTFQRRFRQETCLIMLIQSAKYALLLFYQATKVSCHCSTKFPNRISPPLYPFAQDSVPHLMNSHMCLVTAQSIRRIRSIVLINVAGHAFSYSTNS